MQLFPRSTSSLGRASAAFIGAAVIGLLSVGVVASPASAHTANLSGKTGCNNGEQVVTWTVTNDWNAVVHLAQVESKPAGVQLPAVIPAASNGKHETLITVDQVIKGNATEATLKIGKVTWDGWDRAIELKETVDLSKPCPKPEPSPNPKPKCVGVEEALYTHTFDGAKGTATVTLDGPKPLCEGAKQPFSLISYTPPKGPNGVENIFGTADTGTITSTDRTIRLKVDLPPCDTKVYLVWGDKPIFEKVDPKGAGYGDRVLGSKGTPGSRSAGPIGVHAGAKGDKCVDKPAVTFVSTCKGIDITLTNPGRVPALFIGESKVGAGQYKPFEKGVTVEPGKTASMFVKGEAGLMVRITSGATINSEYSWSPPENCPRPTPSPSPNPTPPPVGEPDLPVTGASVTIMATSALALVGGGVALMVLARRRRQIAPANGVDGSTTTEPDDLA